MKADKIKSKLINSLLGKTSVDDEEVKSEEPELQYVTDLMAGGTLADDEDRKIEAEDIIKIFLTGLADTKPELVTERLPAFMARWIESDAFKPADWLKAGSAIIMRLE